MSESIDGHCLCGNIHYRLGNKPLRSHLCFCTDCQMATGGDRNHVATIAIEDFELLEGNLTIYEAVAASGRICERAFCSNCGCNIYGAVKDLGGMGVNVPCINNSEEYPPQAAVFVSHAPKWAAIPDGIPQYPEMPTYENDFAE